MVSAGSTRTSEGVASSLESADKEESEKLDLSGIEGNLARAFLDSEKKAVDKAKIVQESINRGVESFIPDKLFQDMTKNFALAKNIYGEKIITLISGYDEKYIEKNIHIPDFKKELKKKVGEKIEELKEEGIVNREYSVTEKGFKLASLILCIEELNRLSLRESAVEGVRKLRQSYGEKAGLKPYTKGERYKDIDIRKSLRTAIKRNHEKLLLQDLQASWRESRGTAFIILGIDASASMKGEKIEMCKKAGVALAYKAIGRKDFVGMVVFGSQVKDFTAPGTDFSYFIERITRIRTSRQTNISAMLSKAVELLPQGKNTKHIIILTDALPTYGINPEMETLEAVSFARANGVTISVIGINLNPQGRELAKKIALLGQGRLYLVEDPEELDFTVLEDYGQL